ncbi:CRISPR-associated helicase/endonuclease Cas3 [Clostridium perfringens]|uniref:CRISPR-associated helicase/endonuclease Cas3 n=1 Tax=Clostridium perfringens TaxID=1502 RepID=UPI0006BEEF95|nr:CRISPR-associated helicase/endonuclease Cas3 [Clostridium perfringens]MDH5066285.1 helicase Cas3 [Clostridium perfringens]CUO10715.1 CRISPR-associated helicase Cas3 [Clostridium perfringens]
MYFEALNSLNIDDLIKEEYTVLAHIEGKNSEKETLKMHIDLCKEYFKKIYREKNLEKVFLNFENIFLNKPSYDEEFLFREMLVGIITMHDMGKINPNFQQIKMKNKLDINMGLNIDTNHSIYSSIIYIDYFLGKLVKLNKEGKVKKENCNSFFALLILNSYIISKHHSPIDNINLYTSKEGRLLSKFEEEKIEELKKIINPIYFRNLILNKRHIEKTLEKYKNFNKSILEGKDSIKKGIGIYTYERFMLSILIACDYYSTSEYMNGTKIKDIGTISDINKFYETFKRGEIYKLIREYEKNEYGKEEDFSKVENINVLRNEMFLDAERELLKNIDKNIFYLEAPTGSGKSNVANNLAFKIIENDPTKNKIFYVYPFNTLIEQNLFTLEKIYEDNKEVLEEIAVINSLFPIKEVKGTDYEKEKYFEDLEYSDYSKALLNRQFLNYPMILTTHVSLFSYMFGTMKENIFAFHQLANSVIVLDEIQSYKNQIWREIIEFLNGFSKILNIKIIIMSATLPDLEGLLIKDDIENSYEKSGDLDGKYKGNLAIYEDEKALNHRNSVRLIKDRDKYFKNEKFKNRVRVDYSLMDLEKDEIFDALIEKIKAYDGKKRIVEFISKNSAYKFFEELKIREESEEGFGEIRLLTGDDNSIDREKIINEIKGNKDKKGLDNVTLVATQVIEAGVDIDMDIGFKDSSILDSEEQFLGRINRSCLKEDSKVYFFNLDNAISIYKGDVRKNTSLTIENEDIRNILIEKDFDYYNQLVNEPLLDNTSSYNDNNTELFFNEPVRNLDFKNVEEKMKLLDDDRNDIQVFLAYEIEIENKNTGSVYKIDGEEIWKEYRNLLLNNEMNYAEKMVKLSKVKAKMNYFIYRIRTKQNFNYNDRIGELLYIENGCEFFENGKLNKSRFEKDIGEFI